MQLDFKILYATSKNKRPKKKSFENLQNVYFDRNAKKKTIIKAYRKLAAKWHPDRHSGDDKEHAERMFRDIAAAKEVLTDPGKYSLFHSMIIILIFRFQKLENMIVYLRKGVQNSRHEAGGNLSTGVF